MFTDVTNNVKITAINNVKIIAIDNLIMKVSLFVIK